MIGRLARMLLARAFGAESAYPELALLSVLACLADYQRDLERDAEQAA